MSYRIVSIITMTIAVVSAASQAFAVITQTKNSSDFEAKWEMDFAPSDIAHYDFDNNSISDWEENGGLQFQTFDGQVQVGSGMFMNSTAGGNFWPNAVNYNSGYTVEFRLKVLVDNGRFPWISPPPGIGSKPSPELWINGSSTQWGTTTLSSTSNTDDYHIFRIAQEPGAATFSVWRDGVLLNGADLGAVYFDTSPYAYFGPGVSGTGVGPLSLDYVRYTAGAYAPVPEPSSTLLIFSGIAIGLIGRWRREAFLNS